MALFEKENREFVHYLDPTIVRSGRGLHIYVKIDTVDLTNRNNIQVWKHTMSNLNFLLRAWGADFNCIDTVRILRSPHSVNKKEMFGKNGREVVILRKGSTRHSLEEAEQMADYLLQGGDRQIFESISDSLIQDRYFDGEDADDYSDEFVPIDFEDDIFTGPVPELTPGTFPKPKENAPMEETGRTVEISQKAPQKKAVSIPTDCKFNDSYMGICTDYNELPLYEHWQNRDMLFFISNRSTTEGARNNLLFLFGFNWYHFSMIRDFKTFQEKCLWLNRKYFKPSLPEKEILYQIPFLFKRLESEPRSKYIKCQTILKYINVSEEEKKLTHGNYYEKGTKEYIAKRKRSVQLAGIRRRERNRKANDKCSKSSKLEKAKQYIKENPYIFYEEAKEMVGVCQPTFRKLKNEVWKELGITQEDYLTPFKENPDISYEEYHSLRGGSLSTYTKYKKLLFF